MSLVIVSSWNIQSFLGSEGFNRVLHFTVFTLGFLGLSLRPVEIAPSQLLLWTGSMESCHVQGMTAMGVSLPRHFFKVRYFWKAVGLLVNMYSCIHCYWSTVISKIFCAWTVKRGILWECRMWRRVFQSFLGTFWCRSCAAWYKTGHSRCPWDCLQQGCCGAGPLPRSSAGGRS